MKLKKKEFVSLGVLLILVSLLILTIFSVPAFLNLKENFKVSKYESTKSDIIKGAKSKFSASVSDIGENEVVEYTVKELIEEGYLKSDEINPLTGKKYNEDDKVLVISKNGNLTYKIINGTTLVKEIKQSNDIKIIDNEYFYVGSNPSNYISFNSEIYRVIKLDKNNNIYIVKESEEKQIKQDDIESYLNSYKNDKFKNNKDLINDVIILDLKTYNNTKNNNNESYLNKDKYFWIKDTDIKVYDSLNSVFLQNINNAWISPIIKIESSAVVEKGNGSRVNPYTIN